MTAYKPYTVTKRIKLHTSPLVETDVIKTGVFIKETPKCYVFDNFKVRKSNVIKSEETGGV